LTDFTNFTEKGIEMKKIIAIAICGCLYVSAYGIVNVDWEASSGFFFNANPSIGILGEGTGNSTIAQLMYSPDNVKDGILTSKVGNVNDMIWATKTITEDGIGGGYDGYALFSENYTTPTFTNGWVYALIFQDGNVQTGDWYFYTPMYALSDIAGPNPGPAGNAQYIQMNTDSPLFDTGNAIDSGINTAQVVPEPTTVLLFSIGAIGAWIVRRKQYMEM
jgi:hypothetical protein